MDARPAPHEESSRCQDCRGDGGRKERRSLCFCCNAQGDRPSCGEHGISFRCPQTQASRNRIYVVHQGPVGTVVNPECKYLLLKHAFQDWGAVRIQLGTDANNLHSQGAILKLGAKFEGILRNHGIRPDGSVRDAHLYSIIVSEWPEVKANLLARIESFKGGRG